MMQTIAGTGEKGYAGDGGPASRALLNEPFMCAFDAQGNVYMAEAMNHCVRRIDHRTGVITTVAGMGTPGYTGDGGPATRAALNQPYSLQVDTHGDIYIVDRLNAVMRKVEAATGQITTVAGTGEPGFSGD
jgi:streptogramin lyase